MTFDDKYPEVARPYLACYAVLRRNNKIAMILRKNTGWMDDHYSLPAGKGEWFETFSTGAIREAKEESGVDIAKHNLRFVHIAHRHQEDGDKFIDWVDAYFEVDSWEGEPFNAEADSGQSLDWLDLDNLPENIIPPQRQALLHIAKGEFYSEYGWK
jgi:8-oxo-dGTP diphosphatase